MEVILIESSKLGNVGTIIDVKPGYFRNFLEPKKKAIRATEENKQVFEERRAHIESEIQAKIVEANEIAAKINDITVDLVRQAGEDGRLYGSVSTQDLVKLINDKAGTNLHKSTIELAHPIKYVGTYDVAVAIFADVTANVKVAVIRTTE